jgi:hypothetical protein
MAFTRIFDGKSTLEELQRACIAMAQVKMANVVTIQGRKAQLDDGTKLNVNVVKFEPQDSQTAVHSDIKMATESDANQVFLQQMAAEGRAPVNGNMSVFIANAAETIVAFAK